MAAKKKTVIWTTNSEMEDSSGLRELNEEDRTRRMVWQVLRQLSREASRGALLPIAYPLTVEVEQEQMGASRRLKATSYMMQ